MSSFISTVTWLAVAAGIGYAIWRLLRRARSLGEPEGHPSLSAVGRVCAVFAIVGTITAPAEEEASRRPTAGPGGPASKEAERSGRDQDGRERQAREQAAAERRRRAVGRTGLVTRVIDGDTVELEGVGRVRLIGIDTPERGEECFKEATDYLRGRVGGQTVRYRYQREREDRYGRQLLDIFRGGELVNLDIAEAGWGEELTIAPNDRYSERILEAELEAYAEPRGRWAGCAPEPQPEPEPEPSPPLEDDGDEDDLGGGSGGGEGVPSGTCSEIGVTDFPVPPGDPRDRDNDGIACES